MKYSQYETKIVNRILYTIKRNLDYLTKSENLPQLAKLGFMYDTLFYHGRRCFGYKYENNPEWHPLIESHNLCEDNPKYKLEVCDVGTSEQYDLVYDAWGMHVTNEGYMGNYETFRKTILEGKQYSELELLQQKPNKTMDDYLEIFLNKQYRYKSLFPTKRKVYDYLLCVIGTGYGLKNGYIIEEASGADQDKTLYAGWENCVFKPNIQKIVNEIVNDDIVKEVLDTVYEANLVYLEKVKAEKKIENDKHDSFFREIFLTTIENNGEIDRFKRGGTKESPEETIDEVALNEYLDEIISDYKSGKIGADLKPKAITTDEEGEPFKQYYPISNYSIISQLNINSHPSYIKAGLEIINDIIRNYEELQLKGVKEFTGSDATNIKFALNNRINFEHWVQGKTPNGSNKGKHKRIIDEK